MTNVMLPNNGEIVQMYMSNSVPCTPTTYDMEYGVIKEVNYAELDLAATKKDNGNYMNGHAGKLISLFSSSWCYKWLTMTYP